VGGPNTEPLLDEPHRPVELVLGLRGSDTIEESVCVGVRTHRDKVCLKAIPESHPRQRPPFLRKGNASLDEIGGYVDG
jgi:hypothetical protein